MFKKILILMLLGFSSQVMADSLANEILKNDTLNGVGGIRTILDASGRKCQPVLMSAQVLQQPTDLSYENGIPVSGYWREEWTMKCDNETLVLPVKFVLDATGASWSISPNDLQIKGDKQDKKSSDKKKTKKEKKAKKKKK